MNDQPTAPSQKPARNLGNTVRGAGMFLAFLGLGALALFAMRQGKEGTMRADTLAPAATTHEVSGPPGVPVLRRVMLSTGGVGYFEYEAEVTGTAELLVPVRMDQVDDVLKSIVIFDDRGNTGFVQLPSRAPLSDIFRGLPFGPDALETNAAMLEALKGAEVSVRADSTMSGRIVSVTAEQARLGKDEGTITRHRVGVMTESGLKQFVLEDATSVSFTDPVLSRQIEQALAAVAEHREGQGRTLRIRANGDGTRKVTIGYVVEAPLWKTSYRATSLPGSKARLQGWAVLENVTGNDWVNVDLSVVTGNPVTFRQALYATYYVSRPEVPVEVLGRILPRPDEGSVAASVNREEGDASLMVAPAPPPPPPPPAAMASKARGGAVRQGRPIEAASKEDTTQVTFHMPFTVTVMNGQSLAVPIVDREVPGELVSVYQPDVDSRHPLAALKVTNRSGTSLPAGVLTLYDAQKGQANYVGDAQLANLPDGESRMLGFALDQKVLIDREDRMEQRISQATLANGIFKASIVDQRTSVYTLKGAAKEDRRIIIEHPREAGWQLVTPDPKQAEMTDIAFRIPVDVKGGSTVRQTVTTQWARLEEQALVDLGSDVVLAYAANENLTPAQRGAFRRIGELRASIDALERQREAEEAARTRIYEEQQRIRENIKAVPSGSDLQARYMRSMGQLEDQAEASKRNLDRLQQQKAAEQQKLADYVAGLQL